VAVLLLAVLMLLDMLLLPPLLTVRTPANSHIPTQIGGR
jgi:hypothetical protein